MIEIKVTVDFSDEGLGLTVETRVSKSDHISDEAQSAAAQAFTNGIRAICESTGRMKATPELMAFVATLRLTSLVSDLSDLVNNNDNDANSENDDDGDDVPEEFKNFFKKGGKL